VASYVLGGFESSGNDEVSSGLHGQNSGQLEMCWHAVTVCPRRPSELWATVPDYGND